MKIECWCMVQKVTRSRADECFVVLRTRKISLLTYSLKTEKNHPENSFF
jgi:hypothetical protein